MSDEMLEFVIAIGTLVVLYIGLMVYGYFLRGINNMKNYFKKIKEQSWRKTVAGLITVTTLGIAFLVASASVVFIVSFAGCLLFHSYKSCPPAFHYLAGFLATIGTWMWLWDWAERQ